MHLLFNTIIIVVLAALFVVIMATQVTINGPGLLFLVLTLLFTCSVLLLFAVSLIMPSQLATFAAAAGYQAEMVLAHLA